MTSVPRFWAVDFDRCLADTRALYELFVEILEMQKLTQAVRLQQARQAVEQSGGSFDLLSHLLDEGIVNDGQLCDVERVYCERAQASSRSLLTDGASEFLAYLRRSQQPAGIVSYGDPRWQRLKIIASGLGDMPHMIVPYTQKGREIATWYSKAHRAFRVPIDLAWPETYAEEVVLIDDKASAFDGLPAQARGYWLLKKEGMLVSQRGAVPSSVVHVEQFMQIMAREHKRGAQSFE